MVHELSVKVATVFYGNASEADCVAQVFCASYMRSHGHCFLVTESGERLGKRIGALQLLKLAQYL